MTSRYSSNFHDLQLDRTSIPQERLNLENKERSNLFPWNGQFSPELVEVLLQTYANKKSLVLDPFLGSGTVLYEAGRFGLTAFGTEINPAACAMAQVYKFINIEPNQRQRILKTLGDLLSEFAPCSLPLFSNGASSDEKCNVKLTLTKLYTKAPDNATRSLTETLLTLMDFYKAELGYGDLLGTWRKLKVRVESLPFSEAPIELANCDARALPLQANQVDIVITSPPYINVFNYHQRSRASLESLGWDLLEVARSEIGSNRKYRGNRYLTVVQYCLDMTDVLLELKRVCQENSRVILVVGRESNVRKTRFFNGEIVAALAAHCAGITLMNRQERVFKNKFGTMIYEDILHFVPQTTSSPQRELACEVAKEFLTAALARAPEESLDDLREAICAAENVPLSPLYNPASCQSPSSIDLGAGTNP